MNILDNSNKNGNSDWKKYKLIFNTYTTLRNSISVYWKHQRPVYKNKQENNGT